VISTGKASLAELSTLLSVEDVHDLLEVIMVDAYNARVVHAWLKAQGEVR